MKGSSTEVFSQSRGRGRQTVRTACQHAPDEDRERRASSRRTDARCIDGARTGLEAGSPRVGESLAVSRAGSAGSRAASRSGTRPSRCRRRILRTGYTSNVGRTVHEREVAVLGRVSLDAKGDGDLVVGCPTTRTHTLERQRRWLSVGVVGATIVLVALALLTALATHPFQSADENEHVSYAFDVSSGHLPTLDTVVQPRLPGMHAGLTYTANHPPLFYALEAVPLRLGAAIGKPLAGFYLARTLNVAIAVLGLVALAGLVRVAVPSRPVLAVTAPALLAPLPLAVAVSGQVYNDALALTTTTAALLCCALVLLRGPSLRRLVLLSGAALLVASSRATGLEVAALAIGSAAMAELLQPPTGHLYSSTAAHRPLRDRALRALGAGTVVTGTILAGIGWFYARNRHLYGDLTGAKITVARFGVPPVPISSTAPSAHFWLSLYRGMFGRGNLLKGWLIHTVDIVGLVAGVAAVTGAVRVVAALRRSESRARQGTLAAVLAVHVVACVAILLVYISTGGTTFSRYLLGATPVLAIAVAYGIDAIPRLASTTVVTGIVTATAVSAIAVFAHEQSFQNPRLRGLSVPQTLTHALATNGVGHPGAVLVSLLLALIVGIGAVALSAVKLRQAS